ncbi:MAG: hypothetical protein Q9166_007352 [cf. Caloplaca sp. 2 TL-2023]
MEAGTAIAIGTLCAKVVSIIGKYYLDVKDAESTISYLAKEIQDVGNVMQRVHELLNNSSKLPVSASLETTIKQALSDMELLENKLDPGKGAKAMKRFGKRALKWPFNKAETEGWIDRFQRLKTTVNLALNTDQTSLLVELHEDQVTTGQERQLGKLPFAASACFDSYHRQHETECIENTRVELLQRLHEWSVDHKQPLFWLSGMAGTGKSTIARTLAHRFKSEKILGGNFFFSRASGEANNAAKLVGTLAHHLANVSPNLKEFICEAISSHEDVIRQGLRNQWKELVFTPLSRAQLGGRLSLNIVIDALDECGSEDDIRLILQLFVEVKDLKNIDLGIFITSRPEVVIRLGFEDMPGIIHQNLDLRDVPRHIVEHDISVLLNREFDNMRLQHKLHDWPSEHDKRLLVQRSDCLFIYAVTACRYIGDIDWDPKERLGEILNGGSTSGEATAQLDAMYMHVLKHALAEGRSEADTGRLCDRFKRVVGSIVTLYDELSVSTLAQLLAMQPTRVDVALGRLHAVLNVPPNESSPIRLLHPSFHDFLLNEERCGDKRFCVDEALMHSELVSICLGVLSTALKRNSCLLPTPGSPPQDVDQKTLDRHIPKHVQYACKYWVDHLVGTRSDLRGQSGLCDDGRVHMFFQKDFLHWLEAMSLMGKMSQAVLMVIELANLPELGEFQALRAMIEDARRFILRHRAIIEEAPLQTYASALVFSPTGSLIRKSYQDQFPAWLTRLPAVDKGWGNFVRTLVLDRRISAIAFSSNGKYLASGIRAGPITLWDATTGALNCNLEGHKDDVTSMVFLHNQDLASVSLDGTMRVWEPVTGVTRHILDIPTDDYIQASPSISIMPNGDLAVLCLDRNLRIWSWDKGSFEEPVLQAFKIRSVIGCLAQGMLVVIVFQRIKTFRKIVLFDSITRAAQILEVDDPQLRYSGGAAISSHNMIAWTSKDGSIVLYNAVTGSISELGARKDTANVLAFCPDGKGVVSGSPRSVFLWDLATQARTLIGKTGQYLEHVEISPDGKQIATSSNEHNYLIHIWELCHEAVEDMPKSSFGGYRLLFSPDGEQIAATSLGSVDIRLYNTTNEQSVSTLRISEANVRGIDNLKFSPNGKLLAASYDDGTILLWDSRTGRKEKCLRSGGGSISNLAFSSDGTQLASGNMYGELQIWDPRTGNLQHELMFELRQGSSDILSMTFSFDGKRFASVESSVDDTGPSIVVGLWNTATEQMLHYAEHSFSEESCAIAISPSNRYLVYQSQKQTLTIYDTENKNQRNSITCREDIVSNLAFSGNSRVIALGSSAKSIELWDVELARPIEIIPNVLCWSLSFSADESYLEFDRGHVQISRFNEDTSKESSTPLSRWRYYDGWMMEGERRMLKLPLDFGQAPGHRRVGHHNGLFTFGLGDGIRYLGFTQGEVVTDDIEHNKSMDYLSGALAKHSTGLAIEISAAKLAERRETGKSNPSLPT